MMPKLIRVFSFLLFLGVLPIHGHTQDLPKPKHITIVIDNNYPPYSFINPEKQELEGYSIDLWKAWSIQTGIEVELLGSDWAVALKRMESKQADVIDTIFKTTEREDFFEFTESYANIPVDIYVHHSIVGITTPQDLRGFLIGGKEGDACLQELSHYKLNNFKTYPSYQQLIAATQTDQIKIFCLDEPPANYLLNQLGLTQTFNKAFALYNGHFHRAVHKGNIDLLKTIEQGFAAIPESTLKKINEKWMGTPIHIMPNGMQMIYGVLTLCILGVGLLLWNITLKQLVFKRTNELEQEKQRLRTLIDALPDMIWLKNPQGEYIDCNTRVEQFFAQPKTAIIGKTSNNLLHKTHTNQQERDQTTLESKQKHTHQEWIEDAHHELRLISTQRTPILDQAGNAIGVLGVCRDITEDFHAQERLRLFEQIFISTSEGIMLTDEKGMIVATNTAFTDITGYNESEVLGKTPVIFKSAKHDDLFYQDLWANLRHTGQWCGEVWNQFKNETIIATWTTISAVRDSQQRVTHYVTLISDITALKQSQEKLHHLAHHDALTGLPNRNFLHDRLRQAIEYAKLMHRRLAILFIDLDHFKNINDALGHSIGDQLLRAVAERMSNLLGKNDTLSRVGGDEFVILLEEEASLGYTNIVANRVLECFNAAIHIQNHRLFIGTSIGVSFYPEDGIDSDALIAHADLAMYRAKSEGRNTVQFYQDQFGHGAIERLRLETALRSATQNNELFLEYQPQILLSSNTLAGVEALVRWKHPELGIVSPGQFIPIAEESGLITEIGEWVLKTACEQLALWDKQGFVVPRMAVNLSVQQIERHDLVNTVARLLNYHHISPERLELEVTESILMRKHGRAEKVLDGLRTLGARLAIDDFGTGYSSLSVLKDIAIHRLKIDQSFVRDIGKDKDDENIVRTIIAMGQNLGLELVAEGVETTVHADFLRDAGCQEAQGYLYSRPIHPEILKTHWANRIPPIH